MTKKEKRHSARSKFPSGRKKEEEKVEIDFGLGKLNLGGLFKGIEKLVDLAERAERAGGELRREGEIRGGTKERPMRGIYGFSVRTGLGKERPRVETFGNIKKTKRGAVIEETREPITDVFDEKDYILVIAELPGVDEKSIRLDIKGDVLMLQASNAHRKYTKEILLPTPLDPTSLKNIKFKNGVLEVRIKKPKQ